MATHQKVRLWLVTGEPGVGKSTAISAIVLRVKTEGYTVGGVLTREVRSHGEREGFLLTDISTEESATLASVKKIPGPKVGKYHIDLKSLSGLGKNALYHARDKSDLMVCDEVGPMELLSPEFRKAVEACFLNTSKLAVCVIHKRLSDSLIVDLKNAKDAKMFELEYENRSLLSDEIASDVIYRLKTG
ncbi:MAG: NTPase [Nitrososphaerales archaeon]